ncbi:PLP-dependent aminotransferase family protein [Pseudohoeflea coraliihabitans]|uniref:PLP-dependent aminotransferase family protein n=1 Tax=Pseudohoeflea coraliihabitans TaxID=2860393 RepID=A0ABS6WK93_9HYPH|nr:PLP-dependent aminotransferase family protein [Pseudohoeflea sp. DP4N28-3]MBW3095862.1 PLP-dependent aminotransferase family protein [Pseudohoeflea sp. DP4N28-3]
MGPLSSLAAGETRLDWDSLFAGRIARMKASEIRELLKLLDRPEVISFAGGIPDPALFPDAAFRDGLQAALSGADRGQALQYSLSEGYRPLREWIVGRMASLGIVCDVDNIMITSGSQQALDYLGKLLLSPGDTALTGWPTYLGALQAFNAYEANYDRLVPGDNRSASAFRDAAEAKGGRAKFIYVSADFANPSGETLDLSERQRILALADALDCAVIEDAAYQSLRYEGEEIAPLLALDIARCGSIEKARTIYCGSFSKTLAPGLRVGWVCAPKAVIGRLVLMKQASDLHSATLNQMAVDHVARTVFDAQISRIVATYGARRDAMLKALSAHMPQGVHWTRPAGGMFIWLTLPEAIDGAELLAQSLQREQVAFVPGRAFYPDAGRGNAIRLSFSCADEGPIAEGIARLGRSIRRAMDAATPAAWKTSEPCARSL